MILARLPRLAASSRSRWQPRPALAEHVGQPAAARRVSSRQVRRRVAVTIASRSGIGVGDRFVQIGERVGHGTLDINIETCFKYQRWARGHGFDVSRLRTDDGVPKARLAASQLRRHRRIVDAVIEPRGEGRLPRASGSATSRRSPRSRSARSTSTSTARKTSCSSRSPRSSKSSSTRWRPIRSRGVRRSRASRASSSAPRAA